jgi:hypothetical protein
MRLGAMLGDRRGLIRLRAAGMRGHALAAMEDLDRGRRGANLDGLTAERVGDAVEVAVELDVVVNVDTRLSPVMQLEAFGGQRPEGGSIQLREQAVPRSGTLAEGAVVELLD